MRAILICASAAALTVAGSTMNNTPTEKTVVGEATTVAVPGAPGEAPTVTTVVTPTDPVKISGPDVTGPAAPLPILGNWQCGETSFTVTAGTYRTQGGNPIRINSIERVGEDYRLVLQDAQKIRLSKPVNGRATMINETMEGTPQTASCTQRV